MKRGLTHAEAIEYVGIKRRTFDQVWRPKLAPMRQGSCLIFDRLDLDRLFDEFKAEAMPPSANDDSPLPGPVPQNGHWNGRPKPGEKVWASKLGASTPVTVEGGKSTNGGEVHVFASAVSAALKKRNAG